MFYFKEVREALDFSIYVDVDPKHQLARRINRDQKTRGYSKEDIEYQWNEHVVPCYNKYILPFKPNADFVFRNDDHAGTDLKRLKKELKTKQ